MPLRFVRFPVLLVLASLAVAPLRGQKAPALADVLKLVDDYLAQYSDKVAVVADESYLQFDTSTGQMGVPRRLSADVVFVGLGKGQIATFRDVYAIDNNAVRPHEDRLGKLFTELSQASIDKGAAYSQDSLSRYLNSNLHALDDPTTALEFLRGENQQRSTFKIDSVKAMDGAQVVIVKFNERGTPRIVALSEDSPAIGRAWIDAASGAIRQTELGVTSKNISIRSTVKYVHDKTLDLWLPSEMNQQFGISAGSAGDSNNVGAGGGYGAHQALEARSTYTKFRRAGT